MHAIIYLNKSMVDAAKARVAPVSSAMLYGRGVFTTVAIYNGQPFLWPQHWERLNEHAKKLKISCGGLDEAGVGAALKKLEWLEQALTRGVYGARTRDRSDYAPAGCAWPLACTPVPQAVLEQKFALTFGVTAEEAVDE